MQLWEAAQPFLPSPAPTELKLLEREHDAVADDLGWASVETKLAHAAVEAAKNKTTTNQGD